MQFQTTVVEDDTDKEPHKLAKIIQGLADKDESEEPLTPPMPKVKSAESDQKMSKKDTEFWLKRGESLTETEKQKPEGENKAENKENDWANKAKALLSKLKKKTRQKTRKTIGQ